MDDEQIMTTPRADYINRMLRGILICLVFASFVTTTLWILFITCVQPPNGKPDRYVAKLPGNSGNSSSILQSADPDASWRNTYMELKVKARLGNQLFAYAALREFSTSKNSTPIILPDHEDIASIFKIKPAPYLQIDRSGFTEFVEMRRNVSGTLHEIERLQPGNITFHGYFQSPKYFETVKREIREEFVFVDDIADSAVRFLQSRVPREWRDQDFVRVGIHVRRTDHVSYKFIERLGFRFPPKSYFELAMAYFEERHARVQFVVASDDIEWCQQFFRPFHRNVVYSINHTAAEDLAILAYCNHTITTIGTFSWWAGWLCPGTTIYYANYNKRPSWVSVVLNPSHYIPNDDDNNHWIAIRHKDDKNRLRQSILTEEEWEAVNNI